MSPLSPANPRQIDELLLDARLPDAAAAALAGLQRVLLLSLAGGALLLSGWAALAPLDGAVLAPGLVRTEHNRKVIQHQEGGIVSRLLVRDGQQVGAGELLAVVADVRSDAALELLRDQQAAESIRRLRLDAEAAFATDFTLPAELRAHRVAADILPRERKIFEARRSTLAEQVQVLQQQIGETEQQIQALQQQLKATENGLRLSQDELQLNETLEQQGYVQKARLITLNRVVEDYQGRIGQQRSELSQARQRIQDLQLRINQARNSYQQQSADELKDAALRLRELDEKLRPSADLAGRQNVTAPVAGTVMGLRIGAAGLAVGPREPLMELVPKDEQLVVEARVRPEDIDHVRVGGAARVRFSAFDARAVPQLDARVQMVAPDRVSDQTSGQSWFVAQLVVDEAALRALPQLRLHSGMPAEVYITTPQRSLLAYLVEPIDAFRQRALREP